MFFSVNPNDPKVVFTSGAAPDALDIRYRGISFNVLRAKNIVFSAFLENDGKCGDIFDHKGDDETGKSEQTESRPATFFLAEKIEVGKYYIDLRPRMEVLKFASSAGTGEKWYEAKRAIGNGKKKIGQEIVTLYGIYMAQKLLTHYLHVGSKHPSQNFLEAIGFPYTKWSDITNMDADESNLRISWVVPAVTFYTLADLEKIPVMFRSGVDNSETRNNTLFHAFVNSRLELKILVEYDFSVRSEKVFNVVRYRKGGIKKHLCKIASLLEVALRLTNALTFSSILVDQSMVHGRHEQSMKALLSIASALFP